MIKFISIEIEGFGSIANKLKFILNKIGINVFFAGNGKGKTTIFSALCWCLYGKALKGKNLSTWPDRRPQNYKGTKVLVKFKKEADLYLVSRHQDYKDISFGSKGNNRLVIIKNGKELDLKGKEANKKEIESILGCSFELFKNSVIFGQKMKRIIEEDGPTKKKVFEEAFEISYLKKAKENTDIRKKDLQAKFNLQEAEVLHKKALVKSTKQNYKLVNELISDLQKGKDNEISRIKTIIENLGDELQTHWLSINDDKYEENIKRYQNKLKKLDKKNELIKESTNNHFKLELKIIQLKADIVTEENIYKALKLKYLNLPKKCSECGNKLTPLQIQQQKRKTQQEINACKKRIIHQKEIIKDPESEMAKLSEFLELNKNINDKYSKLNNLIKLEQEKLQEKHNILGSIGELELRIKNYEQDIINIKNRDVNSKTNIKKTKGELVKAKIDLNKSLEHFKNIKSELKIVDWLIKDPLSNSGIKAFIFDEMLSLLNNYLIEYSNELGYEINFSIDMESANKDFKVTVKENKYTRDIEDLSGGERQLINICIAFAIHDIICEQKNINLMVMDECFESLDSNNIDKVSSLISKKANNKSLFIITHQKEFTPANANFIYPDKKNGRTYLA